MLANISKYYKILSNAAKCGKFKQKIKINAKMVQNILKKWRIHKNTDNYTKIVENAQKSRKYTKIVENAQK